MIWIKTKRFPPEGFDAITLWPFVFYKCEKTAEVVDHEKVHERQYLIFFAVGLLILGLKIWLFGSVLNWLFYLLPFVLFYIGYGILYLFKGYDNKLEQNAGKSEVLKFTSEYLRKK